MEVQWEMRAVNSQIMVEEQAQQFMPLAGPRMCGGPEQPMMNNEQVRLGCDGQANGSQAGIDSSSDAGNVTAVFHLQAVDGAVPILDLISTEESVAISYNS